MKIGFIGQGFVGKSIADDYEERGYSIVRYSLESEYLDNKKAIKDCELVFVAVPTPTTSSGFDDSIVVQTIELTSTGTIVVIKSTVVPGTTKKLQNLFPDRTILFSPEFLLEVSAATDARNPVMNIVGYISSQVGAQDAATRTIGTLPFSEYSRVTTAESAELFKYAHNVHGYFRIILTNLLYEVSEKIDANWTDVEDMMNANPMMSPFYNSPVHKSGRGAGGNCFIKDMAAFRGMYETLLRSDNLGADVLRALEQKNIELLKMTGKNLELLKGVYGEK
jgi:UDPglucose 6-dehydrogenase